MLFSQIELHLQYFLVNALAVNPELQQACLMSLASGMDWNLEAWLILVIVVATIIGGQLYSYVTVNYDYWKKRNVSYVEPTFPFGSISDLLTAKIDIGRFYERFYKRFKGQKFGGHFELSSPTLVLTDLDLVKQVVIKDFNHFTDRALPPRLDHDFLMKNLFSMNKEDGWKDMRTKLTPAFTSGKMKLMYTLIEKCSDQLIAHLEPLALNEEIVDFKEVMNRFTLDIIATCAFGLEVNNLANPNTELYEVSQMIFTQSRTFFIKRLFLIIFRPLANLFKLSFIDPKVSSFILNLVKSTVKYREENCIKRNDFIDLLIEVKNDELGLLDETSDMKTDKAKNKSLTLEDMSAQAFIFFAAGFETAASTSTFVLYELACNPEIQEKLRREVDVVSSKHGGHISYQALQEMTYMEQVVNETLRMHGSVPYLGRKCVEPYRIANTDIVLDKGLKVVIPLYAIHHDPDIYPDPEVFDPERFKEENMRSRHSCSFIPFGEGPRSCLGMRFGKLQVKAGLAAIIANFLVSVTPDTPIPVEISPRIVFTTPLHPIRLRITKRKKVL